MTTAKGQILIVQVRLAAYVMDEAGTVLGDNVVDGAMEFAAGVAPPAAGTELTDALVQARLSKVLAAYLMAVRITLTGAGLSYTGQVADPITDHILRWP